MTSTSPSRRTPLLVAGAAAVLLAAGGVAYAVTDHSSTPAKPTVGKKSVLQLTQAGGSPASMSCAALTPEIVRTAAHAFEGTATSVEGGVASFDVTHWFKGGDQAVVTIAYADTSQVEDGISFTAGKTYLVSAGETSVDGCSATGEKGPELEKLFTQAFGG